MSCQPNFFQVIIILSSVLLSFVSSQQCKLEPIESRIIDSEGVCSCAYKDSKGLKTIGVGLNIDDPKNSKKMKELLKLDETDYRSIMNGSKGLSVKQIATLLKDTIDSSKQEITKYFPKFANYPSNVQNVLIDLHFNMGGPTLGKFKKFKAALDEGNYDSAADNLMFSDVEKKTFSPYYQGNTNRCKENTSILKNCQLDDNPIINNEDQDQKQQQKPVRKEICKRAFVIRDCFESTNPAINQYYFNSNICEYSENVVNYSDQISPFPITTMDTGYHFITNLFSQSKQCSPFLKALEILDLIYQMQKPISIPYNRSKISYEEASKNLGYQCSYQTMLLIAHTIIDTFRNTSYLCSYEVNDNGIMVTHDYPTFYTVLADIEINPEFYATTKTSFSFDISDMSESCQIPELYKLVHEKIALLFPQDRKDDTDIDEIIRQRIMLKQKSTRCNNISNQCQVNPTIEDDLTSKSIILSIGHFFFNISILLFTFISIFI